MIQLHVQLRPPTSVSELVTRGAESLGMDLCDEALGEFSDESWTITSSAEEVILTTTLTHEPETRQRLESAVERALSTHDDFRGWEVSAVLSDVPDSRRTAIPDTPAGLLPDGDELAERLAREIRTERQVLQLGAELRGLDVRAILAQDQEVGASDLRGIESLESLLVAAGVDLLDELLDDVEAIGHTTRADDLSVISQLPAGSRSHYDERFVRRFLVLFADLVERLTRQWRGLSCVAQELALKLVLDRVEALDELHLVPPLPGDWRDLLEDAVYEDLDFEMLYQAAFDGIEDDEEAVGALGLAHLGVSEWFQPFTGQSTPAYARDPA